MNLLTQPTAQALQVAGFQILLQGGQVRLDLLPKLRRQQIAQGVGREVAEEPQGPVHVLQASQAVVRGHQPQVVLHGGVPGLGDLPDLKASLQKRQLQLEAQHDVEVVGHLVGLDPHQRGLDAVDGPMEVVQAEAGQLLGEGGHQAGIVVDPEGSTSADQVLPEPRLALVDPHRAAPLQGAVQEALGAALLVQRVPGLVQGSEDRATQKVLVEGVGNPHIPGRHRDAEGVLGLVDPTPVEVIAQGPGQALDVLALARDLEDLAQGGIVQLRAPAHPAHQVDQATPQPFEERAEPGGPHARFVALQESVVGVLVVALAASHLAGQVQHPGQLGGKDREVLLGLGPGPDPLGAAGGFGKFGHQFAGQPGLTPVLATTPPNQVGVLALGVLDLLPGCLQEFAGLVRHKEVVGGLGQGAELLGARSGGPGGHARLLIPREKRRGLPQAVDGAQSLLELVQLRGHVR